MYSYKKILQLSIPIIITFFSYHILGITDILMVGRLGKDAIAGVGIALTVYYLFVGPAEGFFDSATILMSHALGRSHMELLKKYFFNELVFAVLGAVIGLALLYPMLFMLQFFTESANVLALARSYIAISIFSLVPYFFSVVISRFFMSIQKNKLVAAVSNVTVLVNILLNYLLIFGKWGFPAMGVQGAALATLIARTLQAILNTILAIVQMKKMKLSFDRSFFDSAICKVIIRKGLPIAETSLVEFGSWTLFTNLICRLGVTAIASHEIALKIKDVGRLLIWALGVVSTTLIGQAAGNRDFKEGAAICRRSVRIAVGIMAVFGVVLFIFPSLFMRMFTADPEVINSGSAVLRVMALYQIGDALFVGYRSGLNGMGETKFVRNIVLVGGWIIMVPAAFLFTQVFKLGVCGAWFGLILFVSFAAFIFRHKFITTDWSENAALENKPGYENTTL